jgi:hypothetical protein
MTCSRNLFKHLKTCYQTKTNREMLQYDLHLKKYNDFFLPKKKYQIYFYFIFIFQTKERRFIMTCIFECFQSHRHILQELHEFFSIMSAITMFRKSSFHI